MLLWNYSVLNKNPSRSSGWLAFSDTIAPWDSVYSLYTHEWYLDNLKHSALPTATEAPYSWILPPKTGWEMSSTTSIRWIGALSGALTQGGAISASMGWSGSFTSALGLLTTLTSTMAGAWSLTASISASLGLASTMWGTSTLSWNLWMLVPFVANMSWIGALSANLKGMASLSATIYVNSGSATIREIVDGVWNAQTADYVEVGSMWEALPWGGGGGGWATAAQIWSYSSRTLTESAGLSTEEHDKLFSLENSTGGGFSSQAIQTSISNAKREIIEKMEEIPSKIPQVSLENIETTLNEIDSHNSLAKTEIINTIKASENEVCSDIIRKTKELKEDNITTRNLVRQKTKKLDENVSKLADRQDKTDKMIEDELKELENEFELQENEQKEIEMEFDKQEEELTLEEFKKQEKELTKS